MGDSPALIIDENMDVTMKDNVDLTIEENRENIICRLCLKFEGVDLLPLDAVCSEKIQVILPELNVNGSDLMICDKCNSILNDSVKLKETLSQNDRLIASKKEASRITGEVNLGYILNGAREGKSICRICFNSDEGNYTSLNEGTGDVTFTKLLETCMPELDNTVIANPLVCERCCKTLSDLYTFKTTSLAIEEKIKKYCESDPATINLNMNSILSMLRNMEKFEGDNDFLSAFEIKDEEEGDIFDSIANAPAKEGEPGYDANRKRVAGAPNGDSVPKKKAKLTTNPNDDLPNFKFHPDLLFNVRPGITLHGWLALVDKLKDEHKWSDYTTIQKVLFRLKGMPDIYTWFNSIGEILSWKEWKSKLVLAFPGVEDPYLSLRKMLSRRKREGETFVNYYSAKMELLESQNITGEKAVSFLLGGLPFQNILIGCIGRIGCYKTPQEVLEYFKSCDDKQKVMEDLKKKTSDPVSAKAIEKPASKPLGKPAPKPLGKPPSKPAGKQSSKPAGKQGVKNSKVTARKDRRKVKGRCYKCNERGHAAFECRSVPSEPPKPPGPRPSQTNSKNLPKRKKCTYCQNFGHKVRTCPFIQVEKLKQQQTHNQGRQSVFTTPIQCSYCNRSNHTSANCPQLKNKSPQSEMQRPKQPTKNETLHRRSPEPRCSHCGKFGHTVYDCQEMRAKASPADTSRRYLSDPIDHESRRQDKDTYKGPTCHYCGNFGHTPGACRFTRRAVQENFTHSQTSQSQGYKQLLCFKCYKIGHDAADCPRFPQRSYRN